MTDKIKTFFSGKKTHLIGAGLIALGGAILYGVEIDPETLDGAFKILVGAGMGALRLAVKKAEPSAVVAGK